ncbi:MAG: thioredoxin family protein [Bacteroidales bacterium]|nr:thioredoxin family protein [Bacteroidales bacterium]
MKYILLIGLITLTLSISAQNNMLKINEMLPAKTEKMKNALNDATVDLKSQVKKNGLLVIFSCNTCPFVVAWEDRYPMVNKLAEENNIGFVLINSNFMKRNDDDSWEAMKKHAVKLNYKWPYLIDNESVVANAFGAQTTPHVFLFDKELKLVYKGAIDDNYKDAAQVKEFYLKDAMQNLANGKEITNKETRNLGCSIKRKTE